VKKVGLLRLLHGVKVLGNEKTIGENNGTYLTTIAFFDFDFVHEPFQPLFLQFSFTPKKRREGNCWFISF
jgi:hypothetical protein